MPGEAEVLHIEPGDVRRAPADQLRGASRRPEPSAGMTCRHRYEDVGLPCRKTIGCPVPSSRWNIVELSTAVVGMA